jgi:hypothetical protein
MVRNPTTERGSAQYALVTASDPIGDSRTIRISLHHGSDTLWSLTETLRAGDPLEPVLIGIWRVLGEATRRRMHRLSLYVSTPEVVDMLERRVPVPPALGKHFLLARARLNQFGRVRLGTLEDAPRLAVHATASDGAAQRSLFDPALV